MKGSAQHTAAMVSAGGFHTAGLDARAAAIVMRTVRNTVDTGRTVVCTIHQPSIDIFEVSFDIDDLRLPLASEADLCSHHMQQVVCKVSRKSQAEHHALSCPVAGVR